MYSWVQRANALYAYAAFILSICVGGNVLSRYMLHPSLESIPPVHLNISKLQRFDLPGPAGGNDEALLYLDLQADLRDLFYWNTKQIFVFVTASYTSKTHTKNQVVIWDRIIKDPESALINFADKRNKYNLIDFGRNLRGRDVEFEFHWDITPISGLLLRQKKGSVKFSFPTTPVK